MPQTYRLVRQICWNGHEYRAWQAEALGPEEEEMGSDQAKYLKQ